MSETAGGRRLMPVQVEVIKEVLVERILETAQCHQSDELPALAEAALTLPLSLRCCDGGELDLRLRRLGYLARLAEAELFGPAQEPMPGLQEELEGRVRGTGDWAAAVAELSAELAADEPLPKPRPDDQRAVSWKVPGPGGHVRHYVVAAAIADALADRTGERDHLLPVGIKDAGELKRCFTYGFLVRCCEEALAPASS